MHKTITDLYGNRFVEEKISYYLWKNENKRLQDEYKSRVSIIIRTQTNKVKAFKITKYEDPPITVPFDSWLYFENSTYKRKITKLRSRNPENNITQQKVKRIKRFTDNNDHQINNQQILARCKKRIIPIVQEDNTITELPLSECQ